MKRLLRWWRGRKWVYLGQTELHYEGDKTGKKLQYAGVVHFWAWQNNMKVRKWKYVGQCSFDRLSIHDEWYNKNIAPWLEGADMWKPITKPIAVTGTLVDFYKGTQPQP